MTKCDWCPNSRMENGRLVCPYQICTLTKSELEKIMKAVMGR